MKQRIKQLILGLALVFGFSLLLAPAGTVAAVNVDPLSGVCANNSGGAVCDSKDDSIGSVIQIVVNALLFIVGIISVVMIIVGGLRYTTSGGDSGAVTGAKNTIVFAVVGLLVAFLAFAIVNWVLDLF